MKTLRDILDGGDAEQPPSIKPLGWLKTMIDECRKIAPDLPEDADPDSWYMMINEVQALHDGLASLTPAKAQDGDHRDVLRNHPRAVT